MKTSVQIIIFVLFLLSSFLFMGCSSTMKCTLYGAPNAEIYSSKGDLLGQISSSGNVQLSFSRKKKLPDLLMLKETSDSPLVPIGLDYSKRNNTFRLTMLTLSIAPTLWIAPAIGLKYFDYNDVDNGLKLNKRQQDNHDLVSMVQHASNPIEEIKRMQKLNVVQKQNSESTSVDLKLINRTGEYTEIAPIAQFLPKKSNVYSDVSFKGTLFFNMKGGMTNSIKIYGELGVNKEPLNLFIRLKTPFKKNGNFYQAEDDEGNKITITGLNDGNYAISYNIGIGVIRLEFNPSSFVEKENTIDKKDILNEMLNILDAF